MEATTGRSLAAGHSTISGSGEMTHLPVGRDRSLSKGRTDAKKRGAARAVNNDTDDRYREAEGEGLGLGSPRDRDSCSSKLSQIEKTSTPQLLLALLAPSKHT